MTRIRLWSSALFGEGNIVRTLFIGSLVAHFVVFFAMLWIYGPCVFFLSSDCATTNNDTQHYVVLANNLAHGNGYSRFADPPFEPDALRTPLLPLYFVPFTYVGGLRLIWLAVLLLNVLLSIAPIALYKLARFFVPHAYAAVAGVLLVLEPLYVYRSQIAEPDAILVLMLLGALYFLVCSWRYDRLRDRVVCASILGLAILAKPSAQYLAVIILFFELLFLLFFSKLTWGVRAKHFALMLIIVMAIVSPWVIRNKIVFGTAQISSIQAYNLYEYYTKHIPLSGESVPETIREGSREPSRYLPYQTYFTSIAIARIKAQPTLYLKEQVVGTLRNLFVSDIAAIYYYGHTKLLPFPYNPEAHVSINDFLLRGDGMGAFGVSLHVIPKVIWAAFMLFVYIAAVIGWCIAWKRDRSIFLTFTLFFVLYAYLLASSGPYVDAKYRLPGLGLVALVALYGASRIRLALPEV